MSSQKTCLTIRSRVLQASRLTLLVAVILLGGFGCGTLTVRAEETDGAVSAAEVEMAAQAERRFSRRDAVLASVTIFVLAVFVGFEVITKVPPTLHTPLMSGSNAISGITLVGALLAAGTGVGGSLASWLGTAAVVMATVNVVGGFLVTHRMLAMFRRK
jgi:NAD(P) transhydrogenase subunit alpha